MTTQLLRTDKADAPTNEEAVALWRLTLKDHDERKVGRAVADALVELALATVPGFFIPGSPPSPGSPFGVYRPARVPSNLVPQYITVLGGERTVIDSVAPTRAVHVVANEGSRAAAPSGSTTLAPLGEVCGARSGDKGGNANLGVFTRSDEAFAWLDSYLSVDELRRLLPETAAARDRSLSAPCTTGAQLRHPRFARRGSCRLDASRRSGERSRRVVAQPLRRGAHDPARAMTESHATPHRRLA